MVTTWYTIWANVIVIVATYRPVNTSSLAVQRYTCPITLEIRNEHRSPISAEITPTGRFDLIIRFGWWYHEEHI